MNSFGEGQAAGAGARRRFAHQAIDHAQGEERDRVRVPFTARSARPGAPYRPKEPMCRVSPAPSDLGGSGEKAARFALALQEKDLLGEPQAERVALAAAAQESGVEQAGHILRSDRAVGDAALGRLDLDQRLQPEEPARAVARDAQVHLALGRLGRDRRGDALGADSEGRRIGRHIARAVTARASIRPSIGRSARASSARGPRRRS